jgi:hypothetical protein
MSFLIFTPVVEAISIAVLVAMLPTLMFVVSKSA